MPCRGWDHTDHGETMALKAFPDVSFWQGDIDWDKMRSLTDTVVIRVGQGSWRDVKFSRNYQMAKERGMLRSLYWYYDDRVSPRRQAEKFREIVGLIDLPELEIFCDWESDYGGDYGGLRNVVAFMELLESPAFYPGYSIGMYTGFYWFTEHSDPATHASQYQYLKNRPLWLAWHDADWADVRIPQPWNSVLYWQYGTPVVDYGQQSKEIDMNYYVGLEMAFYSRLKTGDQMFTGKTNRVAKVWNAAGTQIEDIPDNTNVRGFGPVGDSVRLIQPYEGYTRLIWLDNYRAETTTPPPPPPPPDPDPVEEYILYVKDGVTRKFIPE